MSQKILNCLNLSKSKRSGVIEQNLIKSCKGAIHKKRQFQGVHILSYRQTFDDSYIAKKELEKVNFLLDIFYEQPQNYRTFFIKNSSFFTSQETLN